jgi:hypothetical protein
MNDDFSIAFLSHAERYALCDHNPDCCGSASYSGCNVCHIYCAYVILAARRDMAIWYAVPFVVGGDDEIGAWRGALLVWLHNMNICRCGEARLQMVKK